MEEDASDDLPHTIRDTAASHGLDIDVDSIAVNEMGLDFRVAIARDGGGDPWVLRLPRRPDVMERAAVEGRLLRVVAPHLSIAVPDWRIQAADLIAYPLLPGEPGLTLNDLGEPIWHADVSSTDYATSVGDFLAQLHAIAHEDAALTGIDVKTPTEVREAWRADIARVTSAFDVADHLTDRWTAWLQDDGYWPDRTVLTHGEVYPGHTLVRDDTLTGVLDWTTAAVDDPSKDFVFHRVSASAAAFDRTVERYVAGGGTVWPRFAEHCEEQFAASPVKYGLYALQTDDPAHRQAAAEQLNPPPDD